MLEIGGIYGPQAQGQRRRTCRSLKPATASLLTIKLGEVVDVERDTITVIVAQTVPTKPTI
jgi:hypothetical protein